MKPASVLNNPHLVLFQNMAKTSRHDPQTVISSLSVWLADRSNPRLWTPFALSLRGFAYEVMDEVMFAQRDYAQGLRLYDVLAQELGINALKRMESNAKFMRIRTQALPPLKLRYPDFVVIEEDGPLL